MKKGMQSFPVICTPHSDNAARLLERGTFGGAHHCRERTIRTQTFNNKANRTLPSFLVMCAPQRKHASAAYTCRHVERIRASHGHHRSCSLQPAKCHGVSP
jgi:hypothetical protein